MGKGGTSKGRTWMIVIILLVGTIDALGLGSGLDLSVSPSMSKEGHYRFAAVAADAEECSRIGTRIMAVEGGSAVDAAIAAILCAGVHNAHSAGIGGGHFLTYYNRSSRKVRTVIAREQAPSAASEDMYTEGKNVSSVAGGKAIGIPGEIRGLYEAHKLGGRLPWKQLFEPAIKLCRDGFKVGKPLAEAIAGQQASVYSNYQNLGKLVTNPETRQLYKKGEIMRMPKLARTLEVIATEGPDAFYTGCLAADIAADIREAEGIITHADLANYTALVKDALQFNINGNFTAFSPPPPSSGAVYLFIINLMNGYNLSPSSVSTTDNAVLTMQTDFFNA